MVGFSRIRKHNGCDEICSLGVIKHERLKGFAKSIVQHQIKISMQPLFLVCIIPHFFEPLGFKIVSEYPIELKNKLNYCTSELVVSEEYVVMQYLK